ncbi:hypothetical protein E2562_009369 [Oryza meyeriana var. granulata]|uniref:Uncharacterized protein n=1 Tax=Oryza meyeriana var. granulata TaxID=110450 RepID=A0A6G1CG77_9ORYZ|nr:hypothetical protein E2562_009369 [Oryza meyeriana var. granulata]
MSRLTTPLTYELEQRKLPDLPPTRINHVVAVDLHARCESSPRLGVAGDLTTDEDLSRRI